ITEIYDYLRVLFARVGKPHCLTCGQEIKRLSNEEIKEFILEKIDEQVKKIPQASLPLPIYADIFSPLVRGRKGEYYQLLYDLLGKGYSEVLVDGVRKKLREQIILSKTKRHSISVLVDSLSIFDFKGKDTKGNSEERLAEALEKALEESAGLVEIHFRNVKDNTERQSFLMSSKFSCPNDGYSYMEIEPRLFSFNSPYGACDVCNGLGTKHFFGEEPCEKCLGARLREEALRVLVGGKSILDVTSFSIQDAADFFDNLKLSERDRDISKVVIKEIESRLRFMLNVGIEYLSLNRRAHTLSGGEAQRIRLASQLGSGLVGALYVLDEPTIGLHQRDNDRLIKTLHGLRDLGNTIIVVEHDEDTIYSSDYIVDIGPGAGVHGGKIVVAGYLDELLTAKTPPVEGKSLTLSYLRGEKQIEIPVKRRATDKGKLSVVGGKIFNIKNLNIDVPIGKFSTITGVSGSGKSSFLYEILYKNLQARFKRRYRSNEVFNCASFSGSEYLGRAILIDQSPIGRTPRSNPVTYTGTFNFIRDLFAETPDARVRGWGRGRFSFNVSGGRCEACQGAGTIAVEMHFLPTVYVTCDVCRGKRFMKETLDVKYKGKSVYDVLEMTVEESLEFFEDIPAIADRLSTLNEVGLGYLILGQPATTLSGGEAQRVKIASELYRPHLTKTIYLLDEPTVGLHYEDVHKLIEILQRLVEKGNTVLVIEHNMDLIKSSDFIIDFGPGGGEKGGTVVARGTPEQVASSAKSYTGQYLKKVLRRK
ncbi:MAG: excinuclease ABC subunit UvrA, partial [Patescibacteria group bacterium]